MERPVNQRQLEEILYNFFKLNVKDAKPLVLLSEPYSGRSSTIKRIAQEVGVSNKVLNQHFYSCPCICDETYENNSFDKWMKNNISSFDINGKYCIFEIDPNEFCIMGKDDLFGNSFTGYIPLGKKYTKFLKSDAFELIAYYPTNDEWIDWAEKHNVDSVIIEFAKKYPICYEISPGFYDRLNTKIETLRFMEKDEATFIPHEYPKLYTKEWIEEVESQFRCIEYMGFNYRISIPLCQLFLLHLKSSQYSYWFEVKK